MIILKCTQCGALMRNQRRCDYCGAVYIPELGTEPWTDTTAVILGPDIPITGDDEDETDNSNEDGDVY